MFEPIPVDNHIVVDEGHDVPGGRQQPGVSSPRETPHRFSDQLHSRVGEARDELVGGVAARCIVDDQHPEVGMVRGENRCDSGFQHFGAIARTHDHRDVGRFTRSVLGPSRHRPRERILLSNNLIPQVTERDLAVVDGNVDESHRSFAVTHQQARPGESLGVLEAAHRRHPRADAGLTGGIDGVKPHFADPDGTAPTRPHRVVQDRSQCQTKEVNPYSRCAPGQAAADLGPNEANRA